MRGRGESSSVYAVPYWSLAALAATPAILATGAKALRKRRLGSLTCARCGYDLRATPGRCPECGAVAMERAAKVGGVKRAEG